jgi:hypothetical protein
MLWCYQARARSQLRYEVSSVQVSFAANIDLPHYKPNLKSRSRHSSSVAEDFCSEEIRRSEEFRAALHHRLR